MAEIEKHTKTNSNTDSTGLSFNFYDKAFIEDLIKCDLCNTIFDSNIHYPLMVKCGHTFCKRCIYLKSNNPDKTINKSCPFDKTKNVMNLDSAINNLKLESIIKKITNFNLSSAKKQLVYSKPVKKSKSPIKSHYSNNAVNIYNNTNNNNNNIGHITIIKNNENNNNNNVNNVNNINKKKECSTSNSIKNRNAPKKKQNKKTNNINFVNTIKNKINALNNNINNINNINNVNNINDINKINIIYQNQNPPNVFNKIQSSEITDNLINPQIDEEINLPNDNFIIEDEKFNKGNNNETIDTIPIEEMSLGNTSFGVDINELLVKSMMTKKNLLQKKQ